MPHSRLEGPNTEEAWGLATMGSLDIDFSHSGCELIGKLTIGSL